MTTISSPSVFLPRAGLVFAICLAMSACSRTNAPADEVTPAAREAASEADAIAVPPPPASEPAASQPQSSVSPAPSEAAAPTSVTATASSAATQANATAPADTQAAAAPLLVADASPAQNNMAGAASPPSTSAASAPPAGGGSGAAGDAPYKVVDGYKVDPATMEGFRAWRAAACDRCHGANQEGMVGPSLIASLKVLTKEQFVDVLTNGRLAKGMPSFKTSTAVMDNMDGLYGYLKGRSDGAITRAKVEPMS